jgi:hypothetical protein
VRVFFGMALAGSLILAGCGGSPADGTLTGHLSAHGGPRPGTQPLPGSVIAVGAGGRYVAAVGSDGTYLVKLPPGVYSVTGTSPLFLAGKGRCAASGTVTTSRRRTSTANVFCEMR